MTERLGADKRRAREREERYRREDTSRTRQRLLERYDGLLVTYTSDQVGPAHSIGSQQGASR